MVERTAVLSVAAVIVAVHLGGQESDSPLAQLRKLGTPESPGSVPTFYAPSAKERALRLQRSLTAAHSWYEKQLNIRVPIALAVLDLETRKKISDTNDGPHSSFSQGGRGLVVLPDRMPPGQPPPGADRDHSAGGILQGEHTLFHEDGHILTDYLKIWSANRFVNELTAGMFMAAYIGAQRPDLNFLLEGRRSGPQPALMRYRTFADLDYLYARVGQANYFWFQWHLERLADFMVKGQDFPRVVEKLQKAFPAAETKRMTIEEIGARLDRIRPGFLEMAGPLVGPTSIPRIMPSACPEPPKAGKLSFIVVHNDTANPLEVSFPDIPDKWKDIIPAHEPHGYRVNAGASVKLPDGTCLVAQNEPTLALIGKQ
jgi:hypothetical protein